MVELRTRKREMREDGTNQHEKLGLDRISCANKIGLPDTAGTSPDPAYIHTDTRSSQPNQACCTPAFSYLLVSSTSFSSSFPISLFLVHNSATIAEHIVKSSLSIPPCHDHVLTPSTAYTESTAYTNTASTQDWLSSLHSHNYELTPEGTFSFRSASLHDRPPSASSPSELQCKVTLSHSHSCELTNWWIESQHPARRPSTASKYSFNLAPSRPPSPSTNSLEYRRHVRTIIASKCITPNSLYRAIQGYPQTSSITASRSASPNSLDHNLGVHRSVHSIMVSKWFSKYARLLPASASPKSLDHGLGVYL